MLHHHNNPQYQLNILKMVYNLLIKFLYFDHGDTKASDRHINRF